MNEIVILDSITLVANVVGVVFLLFRRKFHLGVDIKIIVFGLLLMTLVYATFMEFEWSGISSNLDPYEDLVGALIPISWIFMFYGFIQKVNKFELESGEQRLDLAIKGTRAGLIDWNIKTGKMIVGDRVAEIIGYSIKELAPLNIEKLSSFIHPDDIEGSQKLLQNHFLGNMSFYEAEMRLRHRNGHWVWIIDRGVVVERDKEGEPVRMIGTRIEITKQKELEIELSDQVRKNVEINKMYLAQNEELSESIEEIRTINKELIYAKEKAEESDKLKSAFLANISHEIRTPLNGILGFTNILNNKISELPKEKQKKYITVILESGERMLNIINDLIDISKIEAGQIETSYRLMNVKDLMHSLEVFFTPKAEGKGIKLSCKFEHKDEESNIVSDITKLSQVLSNLIDNAIKYTPEGEVVFGCTFSEEFVVFFVKDTGVGIPHDMKEKIFERFRQINLEYSTSEGGSGLGLTISKAYVEKLGGEICVESELNKGTTFSFKIPRILQ